MRELIIKNTDDANHRHALESNGFNLNLPYYKFQSKNVDGMVYQQNTGEEMMEELYGMIQELKVAVCNLNRANGVY